MLTATVKWDMGTESFLLYTSQLFSLSKRIIIAIEPPLDKIDFDAVLSLWKSIIPGRIV